MTPTKRSLNTSHAPAAIGPYEQGIQFGDLIFTSGQLPIDPANGSMPEGIEAQTKQSLANIAAILEAAGADLSCVLKTTVYLKEMSTFAAMNRIYEEVFAPYGYPARSAVEVARLPKDALIEIEVIAHHG